MNPMKAHMKNITALALLVLFGTSCSAQFPKTLTDAAKTVTGSGIGTGIDIAIKIDDVHQGHDQGRRLR